jgi:hypothetical protein
MSTFYLLPPRPLLGERFADYLQALFPGLSWDSARWPELADVLRAMTVLHSDVYVVHREELPEGEPAMEALVNGFGAEAGDEVIEIRAGVKPGEVTTRRWRVGGAA